MRPYEQDNRKSAGGFAYACGFELSGAFTLVKQRGKVAGENRPRGLFFLGKILTSALFCMESLLVLAPGAEKFQLGMDDP